MADPDDPKAALYRLMFKGSAPGVSVSLSAFCDYLFDHGVRVVLTEADAVELEVEFAQPTEDMIARGAAVLDGWTSDPDEFWAIAREVLTAALSQDVGSSDVE